MRRFHVKVDGAIIRIMLNSREIMKGPVFSIKEKIRFFFNFPVALGGFLVQSSGRKRYIEVDEGRFIMPQLPDEFVDLVDLVWLGKNPEPKLGYDNCGDTYIAYSVIDGQQFVRIVGGSISAMEIARERVEHGPYPKVPGEWRT